MPLSIIRRSTAARKSPMIRQAVALPVLMLALFLSVAPVGSEPKNEEPVNYFPTQVGAKWVYETPARLVASKDGSTKTLVFDQTLVVTAVRDEGRAKVVSVCYV